MYKLIVLAAVMALAAAGPAPAPKAAPAPVPNPSLLSASVLSPSVLGYSNTYETLSFPAAYRSYAAAPIAAYSAAAPIAAYGGYAPYAW